LLQKLAGDHAVQAVVVDVHHQHAKVVWVTVLQSVRLLGVLSPGGHGVGLKV
jgi:hypothetical protein